MLTTNDLPPANSESSPLEQLLRLCEQLYACSDEELQAQLHQLAFAQPERLVQPVRLLLHSSHYIWQCQSVSASVAPEPILVKVSAAILSLREREILALVAQGYTMPQIGDKLFISPATVNNHCARIREKLGLRGRNALIIYIKKSD